MLPSGQDMADTNSQQAALLACLKLSKNPNTDREVLSRHSLGGRASAVLSENQCVSILSMLISLRGVQQDAEFQK